MTYLALYRAWRPQSFKDVTGQKHVTRTLQNALMQQKFSHAYLFSGPRGIGKTSIAKIFAKAINCKQGEKNEPCNQCPACLAITKGELLDVTEIDAASNRGVDEIRDLRSQVKYAPTDVEYKVYIIDEVHMLTNEAFNALLKTLEEPPNHVIFILATTEPHKLPLTIISRCQRFDFQRIGQSDIIERLRHICDEMGYRYQQHALEMIAEISEGGLRDALSLLDQALAFGENTVMLEYVQMITGSVQRSVLIQLLTHIADRDIASALHIYDTAVADGKDPKQLVKDLLHFSRDLLLLKVTPNIQEVQQRGLDTEQLKELEGRFSEAELMVVLDQLVKVDYEIRLNNQPRIMVELLLVQLCRRQDKSVASNENSSGQVQQLQQQLRQLEEQVKRQLSGVTEQGAADKPSRRQQAKIVSHSASGQSLEKIKEMYRENNVKVFEKIKGHWQEILENIKREKVTLHAWVINGEPVAVYQQFIVIAFQNAIHRETTDQASHRQVIEEVIQKMTSKPFQIVNILMSEWLQASTEATGNSDDTNVQSDSLQKAISLFGQEFVEVKE